MIFLVISNLTTTNLISAIKLTFAITINLDSCKRAPRGKSGDQQSLLPRAQRDAQREWMKLRFGCMQLGQVQIVQGQTAQG